MSSLTKLLTTVQHPYITPGKLYKGAFRFYFTRGMIHEGAFILVNKLRTDFK